MTTRVQMIIHSLKSNPDRKFTARELAQEFIRRYPDELAQNGLTHATTPMRS